MCTKSKKSNLKKEKSFFVFIIFIPLQGVCIKLQINRYRQCHSPQRSQSQKIKLNDYLENIFINRVHENTFQDLFSDDKLKLDAHIDLLRTNYLKIVTR